MHAEEDRTWSSTRERDFGMLWSSPVDMNNSPLYYEKIRYEYFLYELFYMSFFFLRWSAYSDISLYIHCMTPAQHLSHRWISEPGWKFMDFYDYRLVNYRCEELRLDVGAGIYLLIPQVGLSLAVAAAHIRWSRKLP